MARSLLENGNDEEIVRSFQSVQENVNSANKEVHQDIYVDDNVLPWSAGEVDKMLLAEFKDFVKEKEELKAIRAVPRKLEFDPTTGKLRVIRRDNANV